MTTPAFRAINTATQAFSTSITTTIPAATVEGDLLLLLVASVGGGRTTPSGWTYLDHVSAYDGTYYNNQYAYHRYAQSGDAGSGVTFTITGGGNTSMAATVSAWSGVQSIAGNENYTSTVNASSIDADPVGVGQALTRTVTAFSCTQATSITVPNTQRANIQSDGSWTPTLRFAVSDDTDDPDTTRTATLSSSRNRRTALTIVLRGGSVVKHWNGASWTEKPLYRWDGSAWVATVLKRYNGSSWVEA